MADVKKGSNKIARCLDLNLYLCCCQLCNTNSFYIKFDPNKL